MVNMKNQHRITALVSVVSLGCLFVYSYVYNDWWLLLWSYLYYKIVIGMFGNQIAQHRYFSHMGFQTTRSKEIFLYCIALTTGINPLVYAFGHRHHHKYSDTELDRHSPHNSVTDVFSPILLNARVDVDLNCYPKELSKKFHKLDQYQWHIIAVYLAIAALISWKFLVFFVLAGIAWNYIHMILFRVWMVHYKLPGSYTNFVTNDRSWNNKFIQLLDWGEGLHNNHHRFPNRYDQAVKPGEFDPVGWFVGRVFAK